MTAPATWTPLGPLTAGPGSAPASDIATASGWYGLRGIVARDLRLVLRRRSDTAAALVFFVLVVSLFPLAIGPYADTLRRVAPGVIWVAALLAGMLTLGRLFEDDHRDGTLDQLLLSPHPLPLLVLGKALAHWISTGLLLALAAPVLALPFDLPAQAIAVLVAGLLLGTPVLSLVGAIGAALTIGLRGASLLLALLVLPLMVPVLVFGAGAVEASAAGLPAGAHLSLLGALLALALFGAPLATAAALRIGTEQG